MPVLCAVALVLTWLVAAVVEQIRVVDAARETARLAARGEVEGTAVRHGRRTAPSGAVFAVRRADGQVRVTVSATVQGPAGVFSFLPSPELRAVAVAAQEPQ